MTTNLSNLGIPSEGSHYRALVGGRGGMIPRLTDLLSDLGGLLAEVSSFRESAWPHDRPLDRELERFVFIAELTSDCVRA